MTRRIPILGAERQSKQVRPETHLTSTSWTTSNPDRAESRRTPGPLRLPACRIAPTSENSTRLWEPPPRAAVPLRFPVAPASRCSVASVPARGPVRGASGPPCALGPSLPQARSGEGKGAPRKRDETPARRGGRAAGLTGNGAQGAGAGGAGRGFGGAKRRRLPLPQTRHFRARRLMTYSFRTKDMFSTVLHDGRRGNEHSLDDEYDQV